MTVRSSAGTKISISAANPATFDAAGYAALAAGLKNIGEVTDLGEFGREYNLLKHNPIASRGTVKKKGSFDEGSITMQLGLDTEDEGQIMAKAAAKSDNDYTLCIETQGGDKYYFQAQVMSFKTNIGSVDSITAASITLEITTSSTGVGVVEVLAA